MLVVFYADTASYHISPRVTRDTFGITVNGGGPPGRSVVDTTLGGLPIRSVVDTTLGGV